MDFDPTQGTNKPSPSSTTINENSVETWPRDPPALSMGRENLHDEPHRDRFSDHGRLQLLPATRCENRRDPFDPFVSSLFFKVFQLQRPVIRLQGRDHALSRLS